LPIENFTSKQLDYGKIRKACKKFVAIHSDDDPYVELHHANNFEKKLDAKIIIKEKHKHFSSADGFIELPVVLEELEKMMSWK
jgi:predicted alpha/beta hydrolase family esterase